MTSRPRRLEPESLTPFDEAARIVRESAPLLEGEEVALADAYGRVLAELIRAPHPVPHFDNSIVDGFAVRAVDVSQASKDSPVELNVVGEIPAGRAPSIEIEPGTCARIMTGAPLPKGADAVVMLEWAEWDADRVRVERAAQPGGLIRRTGEDITAGDVVLEAGVTLGAPEVGALASLGQARVPVRRRPRVAVLVTGDELLSVDESLQPGKIRSSNDYTIIGQIMEAGGDVLDLGRGRDDRDDLARRLEAGRRADVLLTSGGVSVGDHDEVRHVLDRLGFRRVFWRVASSPGKPVVFGHLNETLVFGLPGNPVSSMVSFENFVRPVLRRMQGDRDPERPRVHAIASENISGPGPRRHFARVRLRSEGGELLVREVRPHGSGNLRSMVHANALAVIPEGVAGVKRGEVVEVVLIGRIDAGGNASERESRQIKAGFRPGRASRASRTPPRSHA